jgi:short chain dehydrogenase
MKTPFAGLAFAGFRFPPDVISVAVRWYLRYGLSYRDVEELLAERGVTVDHVSNFSFDGRVAIVTGAGGGLGRTYALELARRGAQVVVNDLGGSVNGQGGSDAPAQQVVDEIKTAGGDAVPNYDSVSSPEGGESIVATAVDAFGKVDVVINNAGILRDKSFAKLSWDDLDAVLDVHLKGAFYVSQPAFKIMKENGYGRFVFHLVQLRGVRQLRSVQLRRRENGSGRAVECHRHRGREGGHLVERLDAGGRDPDDRGPPR